MKDNLLYARRLRENQTFDFYAQRIERIHVSSAYSEKDKEKMISEIKREIEFVLNAIKKAQKEFK